MTVNIRSREFPNVLTNMLAFRENVNVNTAMPLQDDEASTLVDILDQVSPLMLNQRPNFLIASVQAFEAPNMSLDLRSKSVHILRRICGLHTVLPRSCILSENVSKEGDIAFTSGRFADFWKGHHNGNPVGVKALRTYTPESLSKIKQVCDQMVLRLTCA
jgi:hypothetical protein